MDLQWFVRLNTLHVIYNNLINSFPPQLGPNQRIFECLLQKF